MMLSCRLGNLSEVLVYVEFSVPVMPRMGIRSDKRNMGAWGISSPNPADHLGDIREAVALGNVDVGSGSLAPVENELQWL